MRELHGSGTETRFDLSAWLILMIAIGGFIFTGIDVSYRLSLPTDGWVIGEAGDVTFLRDLAGINPTLQTGDVLVAIEGIPADPQSFGQSPVLQERWKPGSKLDYTILRAGEELEVSVTLGNWPTGIGFWKTFMQPITLISLVSGFIQLALSVFIFFRRPGNPATGSFFLIMAMLTGTTISDVIPFGYAIWIDAFADLLQNVVGFGFLLAVFPFSVIRFALTFPRPKPIYLRYPWLPLGAGGVGLGLILFAPDSPLGWFWFVLSLLLAVIILIHNAFTMQDAVSQAQIRWGIGGFVIGIGTLTIMFLLNTTEVASIPMDTFDVVSTFALMVMTAMIAVAISRYRLFDIDIIIRRALQYTLLSGILILVYLSSVFLIQSVFSGLEGSLNSQFVTVITTLGVAAIFNPLRSRVQDFIDRRFFRKKYDAEKAVNDFAVISRGEVDIERLSEALLSLIEKNIQPDQASLWLRDDFPEG